MREARIPFPTVGVEDPERRATPRRSMAVVRDDRFGALADDIAAQADPRPASQLQPDAGRFGDRGREAAGESGRVEDQEQGLRSSGERGQSMESIGDLGRLVRPGQSTPGQVEDEHVYRTAGQQAAGDRETLVQAGRGDDHQPLEPDTASDGLDRVEAARQVEPGHDRALRLGLRRDPQREGGPSAGSVAADRDTGRLGEATRPEDRVERGEAGVDDAIVVRPRLVAWLLVGEWRDGQGSHDPRSCGSPPGPEARDCGIHITTAGRHRTSRIERMFYSGKPFGTARHLIDTAGA